MVVAVMCACACARACLLAGAGEIPKNSDSKFCES